jgi:hypothetical protein
MKSAEEFKIKTNWNDKQKEKAVSLLSHIFAFWSLRDVGDIEGEEKKYLREPHPSQVISIMILLNMHPEKSYLVNTNKNGTTNFETTLIEILTGEGKSITLACLCIVLSILGYNVYQVCYSEYLCTRDYKSFESIFFDLQIVKNIKTVFVSQDGME